MSIILKKKKMIQMYVGANCKPATIMSYEDMELLRDETDKSSAKIISKSVKNKSSLNDSNPAHKPTVLMALQLPEDFSGETLSDYIEFILNRGSSFMVKGVSKGKGFAGVVKRWRMHGSDKTHGASNKVRAIGSIGAGTTMGRVFPGKRMAGHKGVRTSSIRGVKVLMHIKEDEVVILNGSIPGSFNSKVIMSTYVY